MPTSVNSLRPLLLLACCAGASAAHATSDLFSVRHNPAAASTALAPSKTTRANLLPGFQTELELGAVDNFIDEIDELIDLLENPVAVDSVQSEMDRFNNILGELGRAGYLHIDSRLSAPLLPLLYRPGEGAGTWYADLQVRAVARANLLDAPLLFDEQTFNFATASSLYLKSAVVTRVAVGYSQPLWQQRPLLGGATLVGGLEMGVSRAELSKQVQRLQNLESGSVSDSLRDAYSDGREANWGADLAAGLAFHKGTWQVGLAVHNLLSTRYDFGVVGEECERYAPATDARNNCLAARHFAYDEGRIATHERHKPTPNTTLSASSSPLLGFTASTSFDLNAYTDWLGERRQWGQVGLSFAPDIRFFPTLRTGFKRDFENDLSRWQAGVTVGGRLSLDLEVALDSVEYDDTSAPRSAALAISFSQQF